MFRKFLVWLGLAPSKKDLAMKQLLENTYKSLEVVGRGTIRIDPKEVSSTESFKKARQDAIKIVDCNNK